MIALAVVALSAAALGVASLLDLGPFAPSEPRVLEVADRSDDCRDAGRDHGDHCESGADVEVIELWLAGGGTLMVDLQLTHAPDLGPGLEWTAEFYIDIASAYTDGGVICGLSNVSGVGSAAAAAAAEPEPGSEAVSYALDPNTSPKRLLAPDACSGRLDGTSARFSIDASTQPDASAFRLIGVVRIEFPGDRDRPGTEDDFLVRASLADLRR